MASSASDVLRRRKWAMDTARRASSWLIWRSWGPGVRRTGGWYPIQKTNWKITTFKNGSTISMGHVRYVKLPEGI